MPFLGDSRSTDIHQGEVIPAVWGDKGGGSGAEALRQNGNPLAAKPPVGYPRPKGSFGVSEYKTVPRDFGNV